MKPRERQNSVTEALDDAPPTETPERLAERAPTATPETIGRYRLERLLGRGGMGSVYLAHDPQLDRPIALKIPNFGIDEGALTERFLREARAAGRVRHPNICPVYDVGEADGVQYLCMAYVEGQPLTATAKEYANRPPRDAAALVHLLALALEEAHRQGIIHRDLKPGNVMIDRRGQPVVMDFGLARDVNPRGNSQTQVGVVIGTPFYMSPEQVRGETTAIGPGCDVYALGVILYELLTGTVPFQGSTMDVLMQHVRDQPLAPSGLRPDLDADLEAICLKALAKEPGQRFLSMAELASALKDYAEGTTGRAAALDDLEPSAADSLVLLRTWGWEAGILKLQATLLIGERPVEVWLMLDWLRGEDVPEDVMARFRSLRQYPFLAGWALVARAWIQNRGYRFERALVLLREAAAVSEKRDPILEAAIAYQRGFALYQLGRLAEALKSLHEALGLCGQDHFLTADVVAALGLVYANKNNFQAAHELMQLALSAHQRFDNDRVLARGHRYLGELYLDWGYLDRAQEVFQRGLERALKSQDERTQGVMFHMLGRTAIARAEQAAGRPVALRKELNQAGEWLDASVRVHQAAHRAHAEGGARVDRALAYLLAGDAANAKAQLAQAEQLVDEGHPLATARLRMAQGVLASRSREYPAAERLLRQALGYFDRVADYFSATRAQFEMARTLAASGAVTPIVSAAYLDALKRAEGCRRPALVRAIEEELEAVDQEARWRHVFARARGRSATADTCSLAEGSSEAATVLCLSLRQFAPFCQGLEPEEVMQTINHLLADLEEVLSRADAEVVNYQGGGFLALLRGAGHAWRGVDAGLDLLAVVEEFNRPRRVLGLIQLPGRVAVASGTVFLGNIGTYRKMDFTAVGNAVNLASRLVAHAEVSHPCVSRETKDLLGDRFQFVPTNPRSLELGSMGSRQVWDVTGRKQGMISVT